MEAFASWSGSLSTSSGRTLSGWRFETTRGDLVRPAPDGSTYVAALVMVLSGAGQARLLWALGNPARAILDGEPLLRVLHDLPVAEATGSEAQLIVGMWRLSTAYGIAQYTFRADGSFERGMSATTRLGNLVGRAHRVSPCSSSSTSRRRGGSRSAPRCWTSNGRTGWSGWSST